MSQRPLALALCPILLAACSASTGATDAGPPDTGAVDAFAPSDAGPVDAASTTDASSSCDVGTPPDMIPALTGEFVVDDADGGSLVPVQTGGDPVGVWRVEHVTIYTAPESAGMFDPATSTIDGSGWLVVEPGAMRMELVTDVALMGTVAGTIRRHTVTQVTGDWAVMDQVLDLMPVCTAPPPMDGGMRTLEFTAGPTDGTLVLRTVGMTGPTVIVMTGTRSAT